MIIRATFPSLMEATVRSSPGSLEIEPIFYRRNGKPICMHLCVEDANGDTVGHYVLQLGGATAELSLSKRNQVTAQYDEEAVNSADDWDEAEDDTAEASPPTPPAGAARQSPKSSA